VPMTYFADLTPYTYLEHDEPAVNIGWLDAEHAFPKGQCPGSVVAAHGYLPPEGFRAAVS
jgi:hypothetical protein